MLNIIIISLQSVNEWPVFNLKKHIDKHSKITASKDSLQYLIRLLSSKHLLCSLNIWNFYYCQLSRRSILDSLGLQRVFRRTNLAYRMHLFGGLFQTWKKKEKTE
jgi:hypothetical protein